MPGRAGLENVRGGALPQQVGKNAPMTNGTVRQLYQFRRRWQDSRYRKTPQGRSGNVPMVGIRRTIGIVRRRRLLGGRSIRGEDRPRALG